MKRFSEFSNLINIFLCCDIAMLRAVRRQKAEQNKIEGNVLWMKMCTWKSQKNGTKKNRKNICSRKKLILDAWRGSLSGAKALR